MKIFRKTKETSIYAKFSKNIKIKLKVPFLKHLLEQMFFHSKLGITLKVVGDFKVDTHHIIEDTGIVLGKLFNKISNKIYNRFVFSYVPLDEALSKTIIDVSNRGGFYSNTSLKGFINGNFDIQNLEEFINSFAINAKYTIHINCKGKNKHHVAESLFKSLGLNLGKIFLINTKIFKKISTK
ncbi:imidazoleglycerol-phosphate dehydratase HisB [Candidatus Vidania fulgoroideorum]